MRELSMPIQLILNISTQSPTRLISSQVNSCCDVRFFATVNHLLCLNQVKSSGLSFVIG